MVQLTTNVILIPVCWSIFGKIILDQLVCKFDTEMNVFLLSNIDTYVVIIGSHIFTLAIQFVALL